MWVKIDDQFPTHPKVIKAGLEAAYVVYNLTLLLSKSFNRWFRNVEVTALLTAMSQISNGDEAVKRLVEVGLWDSLRGRLYYPRLPRIQPKWRQDKGKA